jgi:hypothetical protein
MELVYQIQYSNRKTLGILVDRDKSIFIKAPYGASKEKIEKFIEKKKLWIFQKLNHKQKYIKFPAKEFVSGSSILYLGRTYLLNIGEFEHEGIKFSDSFYLSKRDKKNANELFKKWFIREAKKLLIPKIIFYAKNLGVKYNKIEIKEFKYRWGSCTPKNNIYFNWRIIQAPNSVIDYIIVHELAHLIEANHSSRFWNIVKSQLPKFHEAKNWLKENGGILEIDFE